MDPTGGDLLECKILLNKIFRFFPAPILAWAGLTLLLCCSSAEAQNPAPPQDITAKISALKVEGNKNVSALLLFGHLTEKEGDSFSLRKIRMDLHNLFAMGDFTSVKADVQKGDHPGELIVTFKVEERPLVGEIVFRGNKKWDSHKFLEDMKTSPGEAFDPAKLNDDLDGIRKLYRDEGYPTVLVSSSSQLNSDTNKATVIIDITEGDQIKVGYITVTGNQAFSAQKVANQIKKNRDGEKYQPEALSDDLKAIEDFYHDEGYLKAIVLDHKEKLSEARKRVYLYITVEEGVQYTLGDVQFHGNVQFDDIDLKKSLNLSSKDILRQKDLDDGLKKMKTLYADKGYIYASLTPQIAYDDDLKKADLTFNVIEGQVAYVQDIKIVGNYKTQDYVIRRELLIKPGDKFEADMIKASAGNLYNLGFFDEVNPEVEPGDSPGKEILVFRIKERKTGTISLGGGYSSVDGFIGNLKLEEANLFGKGQKVNLDLQFGASQTSFDIGFTEPWLFNTPTSLGLNFFDTTRIYTTAVPDPIYGSTQFYTEVSLGGSISVGRRLSRFWTVNGTYLLENVQIKDVGQYYQTAGTSQYIQATSSTTSSLTPRLTYDDRDNYFDPHTGWRHQLSLEVAGGPLGADNNFVKLIEDTSHFIPLPLDFVIGEHVRFGAAQGFWFSGRGYSDVPIYEKFYAGGTDTIRGYNERTIGPVQGGNALFVSNTELKHPIAGPLRGVIFFDSGDAWTTPYNIFSGENQVQFGAGIGVRLTIPGTIMDIRLDYGWPISSSLPATAAPPGGVLHFNLGNLF